MADTVNTVNKDDTLIEGTLEVTFKITIADQFRSSNTQ